MGREKSARTGADAAEATTRNTKTTGKSRMFRWKRNMAFLRLIEKENNFVNRGITCCLIYSIIGFR
jgi:hypothetical protein